MHETDKTLMFIHAIQSDMGLILHSVWLINQSHINGRHLFRDKVRTELDQKRILQKTGEQRGWTYTKRKPDLYIYEQS